MLQLNLLLRYTSRTTLINHVHDKHPEEISREQTTVSCAFCSTSFESNEPYFSHVASEHQDEARDKHWVACHFCTSYVPSETRYVIHRAIVHPSDSRNAIFRSSDHTKLADYKRRQKQEGEGGDLRLPCHYCLESFTAQGSLNTHMNVKHRTELIQANWDCCPGITKYLQCHFTLVWKFRIINLKSLTFPTCHYFLSYVVLILFLLKSRWVIFK